VKRVKYWAVVDAQRLGDLRTRLIAWFSNEGRVLPWRETRDPYAILVSEILLHQTTVATVSPVYERFLARFPTVSDLAQAPLDEIKAITDPLGYKVRGSWLSAIARAVVRDYDGRVPDTLEALMSLPGVGRYTAGAVLAFAYGRAAGILDTNVARVMARLFRIGESPGGAERLHRLWALAEAVVPETDPWRFNQGLMDLGATVCRARKPACLTCPLAELCPSRGLTGGVAAEGEPDGVMFWERPRPARSRKLADSLSEPA
jgi:A/G-specific adenine glycosylase